MSGPMQFKAVLFKGQLYFETVAVTWKELWYQCFLCAHAMGEEKGGIAKNRKNKTKPYPGLNGLF